MLLMNSKLTICKYVQECPKITTTTIRRRRSRSIAADKNVVLQSTTTTRTTTRLEFVSKKFRLMSKPAVTRKKCHKLIQRKYRKVICFKIRRMAKKCQQTIGINNKRVTTTCCERKQEKRHRRTTTLRSNNGSYFSKTKKRKSTYKKQHYSLQERLYYSNKNNIHGSIRNQMQQQQEQQQNMIKRNFQILRLYARSGVHLRRRRKRRFFINLYTNTLQFRKLKAIKRSTALMHNNMMPLKATISLSSLDKVTVNSATLHNKQNQLERTKCTIKHEQNKNETENKKHQHQHQYKEEEYKFEKSNGNQIYSLSTTAHSNSKNGNGSWRLLLTSLIALTASTGTVLSTGLSDTLRKTLTTLFQRLKLQLQLLRFCQLNTLNKKYSWIFLLIYLHLSAKVCLAGYHEKRLLHDLLDPYNTLERPVLNESDPLQLSFGLTLMQIIDVDEKNQLLVTNVWLKLEWNDMNLRWNTSDYGGVKDLRIPPHRIWKPDVLMYNSADEGFDGTYQTNVVVRNNGSCLYVPPGIFKSTCKIDITWFPFDDQRCEMKFGSWTYDGFQLDLQLQDETGGDIGSYVLNGEWELLGVPGKRNEIYYNCCPEPYIDITFAIIIRRRTLYYFFNLIIPCVLIASMALLGFTLPPDSGEKLSLGVTILLSLTVFLNMVAETMPATSDAVPLLGAYFNCIMFMVASSVVSTILVLNYHHRNADTHEMSEWIRIVFLCWLPWILRMSRPGRPLILEFPTTPCSDSSSERKHQILSDVELKERSSKSLLANVLDIDDDFRAQCRPMTPGGTLPHNPAFYRTVYGQGDDGSIGPIGSTRMPDAVTHHTCLKSSTEYELSLILKEIRYITDQLRKEDEDNDIANDWKFAAMVVDRLCLIIFTVFAILATIAVLLSAPHVIVS